MTALSNVLDTIGKRYTLLSLLGVGGMGEVFQALDRLKDQLVALKRVTMAVDSFVFQSTNDAGTLKLALAQEFKILASLRHPNIIGVQDYGFDRVGQPYFTMDLLTDAQNILVAAAEASFEERVHFLAQTLQALIYLHRRKVLHRDIKPSNILTFENSVKLLDFGLAIGVDQQLLESGLSGTLAYMAPELLQGAIATEQTDLYAVGVLAYEMFVGSYPFQHDIISDMIKAIIEKQPDLSKPDLHPGISRFILRLMAKDPRSRCQSALETVQLLSEETNIELPLETSATRESFLVAAQLVGRVEELAQLQVGLQALQQARGSTWFVGGESGTGKSRLLDEARVRALVAGVQVFNGQAIAEGSVPYLIWRDVLRQLCLQTEHLSDFEASVLKPIVPGIETLLDRPISDPPPIDPQAAQERLVQVVSNLFEGQKAPTFVLLEDFHWAGDESLVLLQRVAKQIMTSPVMLAVSFRIEETANLPTQVPDSHYIQLARLSNSEVAQLSASMLGEKVLNQSISDFLERETEGNVFFIIEVMRTLGEQVGQLSEIGRVTLPSSVFSGGMQAVIKRRLQQVSSESYNYLQIAALAGRKIDLALMVGFMSAPALQNWLAECENTAVFDVQENNWRFAHDKLRETVVAQLEPATKQELHRKLAEQIEKTYPGDPAQTPILAYHWGQAKELPKEFQYTTMAGEQAWRTSAYTDALQYLGRSLALADAVGATLFQKARLLYMVGDTHFSMGQMNEGSAALEQVVALLQVPKYSIGQVLGAVFGQVGHRALMDVLPQLWRPVGDVERLKLASRSLEKLGQVYYVQNKTLRTSYAAFKGLNLSEMLGAAGKAEQARFYAAAAVGFGTFGQRAMANYYIKLADRSIAQSGDLDAKAWMMEATSAELGAQADWKNAFERLKQCLDIARQTGQRRRAREGMAYYAPLLIFRADWATLEPVLNEFVALTQDGTDLQGLGWCKGSQAMYALRRGRLTEALAYAEQGERAIVALQDPVLKVWIYGQLLRTYIRLNDQPHAAYYAQALFDLIKNMTPQAFYTFDAYVGLAEYYLAQQEQQSTNAPALIKEHSAKSIAFLARYAKIFTMAQPSVAFFRAWHSHIIGQPAERTWQRAIATAQKFQMPYEEGLAYYHQGRLSDGKARRELLKQAVACFQKIGAVHELAQAQSMIN